MKPFWHLVRRDLLLAWKEGGTIGVALGFYLVVVTMMPLSLGPDLNLLSRIAPGLLWVALYWWEVPTGWGAQISDSGVYSVLGPQGVAGSTWLSPVAVVHWRYFYHLALVEALVVATFIDFDLWIIPDGVTVPTMAVGLVGSLIGQVHLVPVWFQNPRLLHDVEIIRDVTTVGAWVFPTWLDPLLAGPPVPAWVPSSLPPATAPSSPRARKRERSTAPTTCSSTPSMPTTRSSRPSAATAGATSPTA